MKLFIRSGLLLAVLAAVPVPALATTYTIDPSHTAVEWHISHFGFSSPSGKFPMIEGKLELDEKTPQNSRVEVTIPIDKITTGVEKLDEHLKGSDFFDAEAFPTATFVSSKVTLSGAHAAKVEGVLTLHGVAKPVVLNVTLNKQAKNMFKRDTAGFSADAVIKRSDFGIKTYLPDLGDEIKLHIESEANI